MDKKNLKKLLGKIDPFKIEDYIFYDGYQGLSKNLEMKQVDLIEKIKRSGLRGRGGAGFSTGVKWNFAYNTDSDQKYMVCNADEGDPGAYMNRAELEGNPHAVLEGMAIGGYAIGANKGYIYCRAEYPLAVKRIQHAIDQAQEARLRAGSQSLAVTQAQRGYEIASSQYLLCQAFRRDCPLKDRCARRISGEAYWPHAAWLHRQVPRSSAAYSVHGSPLRN